MAAAQAVRDSWAFGVREESQAVGSLACRRTELSTATPGRAECKIPSANTKQLTRGTFRQLAKVNYG